MTGMLNGEGGSSLVLLDVVQFGESKGRRMPINAPGAAEKIKPAPPLKKLFDFLHQINL